jgi:hypothetical protein
MRQDPVPIEGAIGQAHRGDRGADDETEFAVARGLAPGLGLGGDALDVREGHEAAEVVTVVHHEHLVNADVLHEEGVRRADRVGLQITFMDGKDFPPRDHGLGDLLGAVAIADAAAR